MLALGHERALRTSERYAHMPEGMHRTQRHAPLSKNWIESTKREVVVPLKNNSGV